MDAAAEIGRNPVVRKHRIQPEYRDEQADAGRYYQTRLARLNSQARTETQRGIFIFPVQLTTSRIGNLTRLIPLLLYMMTVHYFWLIRTKTLHTYHHNMGFFVVGLLDVSSIHYI